MSSVKISDNAKSIDYIIRSLFTGILALIVIGTLSYCAITQTTVTNEIGSALLTATGVVIGFFFGNHAAVNGSMIASIQKSDTDNSPMKAC